MTRVAVPLARPAVAALTVFAFLAAWNQYLWPLLVTKDDEFRTVQIGLKQLRNTSLDQINVTFAGVVIAVIPLAALKKADKPVEITMWYGVNRASEETLQRLTDTFNSSQSDVHVTLVNQTSYRDTFTKYVAGLSTGDLPDIAQ